MKIQSLFSLLTNVLTKNEVAQVPGQGKMMRPLSSAELAAIAGGPDVENDPPPF